MPYYFMRDTPLQALEQLMMSQPGQKPRGGGIYRSPFRYTPEDVACEYCQNYVRKHPCRLCECTCLEERIEPELYSVYQAAKAIAIGCCNITLADLASPELVTDEAFHLITGALLMAKYGDVVLNLEKGADET